MLSVTTSIPEPMNAYVERQVEAGGYGNVSEYFRSLVEEAQKAEADRNLEGLLMQGIRSGDPMIADETFSSSLRAEAGQIAADSPR